MFIPHNHAQLYTVVFGQGPQTLVVHGGWTGSWELWTEPLQQLSRTWRTVAYDHRGTGVSTAPVESISLPNLVDDLFAVLDQLGIEQCVLAAESAGGLVAVNAVLQQPARFTGLVLVDALLYQPADGGNAAFIQGLQTNFEATVGTFVDRCVLPTEAQAAAIRAWGRKILARSSPEAAVRLLACVDGVDLRPRLAELKLPTLVLHGAGDLLVPVSDSEYAAGQIAGSRLEIMPGAGHVPSLTRPHDVADAIDRFFQC